MADSKGFRIGWPVVVLAIVLLISIAAVLFAAILVGLPCFSVVLLVNMLFNRGSVTIFNKPKPASRPAAAKSSKISFDEIHGLQAAR